MELCSDDCMLGIPEYDKIRLFSRIRRKIGAPAIGVEILDEQLEDCVCEAIEEYSSYISQWSLENKISQMLGLPNDIDFTLKFVTNNFSFEKSFAQSYSEQAGTSIQGPRELKKDFITLTAGTQDYFIPADREVNEILWFTPSFVNTFGLDPFAGNNFAYSEFGASFSGYELATIMPVFDTLLSATAAKVRNKVRNSEYSYRIIGGPDMTKRLSLYPVPKPASFLVPGQTTPGTMFYFYYDSAGLSGNIMLSGNSANPDYTGDTGNGLVSGPSDAKIYNLSYSGLNDAAQTWVKKYAQALAKETLGYMRSKFDKLPIPDSEIVLNGADLIARAREDKDLLTQQLQARLDKLNYKAILENNAAIQESVNKTLGFNPMGIFLG